MAFANSHGEHLVLGVSDVGKEQQLDRTQLDAWAKFVKEICTGSIEPPPDFSICRVPAPTGGAVLLV